MISFYASSSTPRLQQRRGQLAKAVAAPPSGACGSRNMQKSGISRGAAPSPVPRVSGHRTPAGEHPQGADSDSDSDFRFRLPPGPHSNRSASTGSNRAALLAGPTPNATPITIDTQSASTTAYGGT